MDQVNDTQDQGESQATETQNQDQSLGWRSALPNELKDHEYVKTFTKPGDFVKSALEIKTERDALTDKLGKAVFKPGENATEDELKAYRTAMNIPQSQDEYEFKAVEGLEQSEEMKSFSRQMFFEAGLTKDQASLISEKFDNYILEINKATEKSALEAKGKTEAELKKEWGSEYDKNYELTKRAFQKFSSKDLNEFLDESGMGNNPVLIKAFHEIGKALGEDSTLTSTGHKEPVVVGMKYDMPSYN